MPRRLGDLEVTTNVLKVPAARQQLVALRMICSGVCRRLAIRRSSSPQSGQRTHTPPRPLHGAHLRLTMPVQSKSPSLPFDGGCGENAERDVVSQLWPRR
jgi:hypothetical protein